MIDLAEVAGRLAHLLRAAGVPVTAERAGSFARALELAAPATTDALYWVARTTLLHDRTQLAAFDRVFRGLFEGFVDPADHRGDPRDRPSPRLRPGEAAYRTMAPEHAAAASATPSPVPRDEGGDGDGPAARDTVLAAMSDEERLRTRGFATLSPEELRELRTLFSRLALAPPPRASRRRQRHPRGDRIDLRATLARAHRTAGDPLVTVRRRRRTRPRRLVVLCDVSGSMEPYARAYLQLLHSAVGGARAEAFVFATRLTRVTRALRTRDPDLALYRAGSTAQDWSGGTRIADALADFLAQHGRRGMARGAVVVVVSDGWERGDPDHLGAQMARLRRLAYRVVWVNPRRANPRFAPLAGGMAAALPHVDAFVSGHSAAALDELLAVIAAP